MALSYPSGGQDGRARVLSDFGLTALNIDFTDGSSGLFLSQVGDGSIPGDADLDGDVDLDDFVILKINFGTGSTWEEGDFDGDGDVDLDDFVILKTNFGT